MSNPNFSLTFSYEISGSSTYSPLSITPTNYNPLTNTAPDSGTWYYYLINYGNNPDGSFYKINFNNPDNLAIPLNICLVGTGGLGGQNGTAPIIDISQILLPGYGGGGGSGQVLLQTYSFPNNNDSLSFELYNLGSNQTCNAIYNINNTFYSYSVTAGLNGQNGGDTTTTTPGNGGNGGNGGDGNFVAGTTNSNITNLLLGGAGGVGGDCGFVSDPGATLVGTYGNYGLSGISYNGATNSSVSNNGTSINGYTPVNFADGQSANIAYGGLQNTSGSNSYFMVYYNLDANIIEA
jgi:hypothetical protein